MLAQPGGYFRWPGLLERQAANGTDDLDAAFAGRRDDAFAGDPDDPFGVGAADTPSWSPARSNTASGRPSPTYQPAEGGLR
jgi:hypothetical protein